MINEQELERFKQQYADRWERLMADHEFAAAWKAKNLVHAGERAQIIVYGNANTKKEYQALKLKKKYTEMPE